MNKLFYEKLGEVLKQMRINKGYSQQYVSDRLGISRGAYSHFENGKRMIDIDMLYRVSDIYGVDINDITNQIRKYVYKR